MLVLAGKQTDTPTFVSRSWFDDSKLRIGPSDRAPRSGGVHGVVLHTTHGKFPQPLKVGLGTGGGGLANITYWNRDPDYASAHLLVDRDGAVLQTADLVTEQTWHATSVNQVTVGIEIVQGGDNSLYTGQIDVVVRLVDFLTAQLGIQRQMPLSYTGKVITRLHAGAHDFVGVFGHRDQTSTRGRGDPGDAVMDALAAAGYERFDLEAGADLTAWKARQQAMGLVADGVPGKLTVAALKSNGKKDGIWVQR